MRRNFHFPFTNICQYFMKTRQPIKPILTSRNMQKMIFRLRKKAFSPIFAATVKMTLLWKNSINFLWIFETNLSLTGAAKVVFGVFSPGRTHCIAPKKLPDKAMSIWNLHKKFQLSSAMGLRDFDLQSQPTLMGGNPLIVVHCRDNKTYAVVPRHA